MFDLKECRFDGERIKRKRNRYGETINCYNCILYKTKNCEYEKEKYKRRKAERIKING